MPWKPIIISPASRSMLCGTLVLSIAFTSCRPLFRREVAGMVLAVAGSTTPQLQSYDRVRIGQTLGTSAQSKADLMLLPGILLALDPETTVEIAELDFAKNGDKTIHPVTARNARIRMQRGTLCGTVGQSQTPLPADRRDQAGTLVAGAGRTFEIRTDRKTVWIMSLREPVNFAAETDCARDLAIW